MWVANAGPQALARAGHSSPQASRPFLVGSRQPWPGGSVPAVYAAAVPSALPPNTTDKLASRLPRTHAGPAAHTISNTDSVASAAPTRPASRIAQHSDQRRLGVDKYCDSTPAACRATGHSNLVKLFPTFQEHRQHQSVYVRRLPEGLLS